MITCRLESGKDVLLRHAVVHCLVLDNNKILLIKRANHIIEGGKWGFPGGYVDRDETLEGACVRELQEETGYEGKVTGLLRLNSNPNRKNDDRRQNIAFEFLMKAGEKVSEPDDEQTESRWIDIKEVDLSLMAFDQDKSIEIIRDYLKGNVTPLIIE